MISIGKPFVTVENDTAYLRARVVITDDTAAAYIEKTSVLRNTAWLTAVDYPPAVWKEEGGTMWFSVQAEYAEYLCTERSDAFVIALFWYGMVTGSDISFEAPMSKALHDGVMNKLVPALTEDASRTIKLLGPLTSEKISCEGGVLTGMSCGVDSMYTLHCYDAGPHGENCGMCYACEKTIIPLDIIGKLDLFRKSFDVDGYYARREAVFEELIRFSRRPEAASARESVRQIIRLAEEEDSEAGRLFLEKDSVK